MIAQSLERATQRRATERRNRNQFAGAMVNRLNLDWITSIMSADQELRSSLWRLRSRSRELAANDPYMAGFVRKAMINIVGPEGMKLQAKVRKQRSRPGYSPLNEDLNDALEDAWERWGQMETASLDQKATWTDHQEMYVRSLIVDGEVLYRKIRDVSNPFGYTLQQLDPDQLDANYTDFVMPTGNRIIMGIEMDERGRNIAYWIWDRHPNDAYFGPRKHLRVPADEIIHDFIPWRVNQYRGIPWATPTLVGLNMLRGYREAEVIRARADAAAGGFIETEFGEALDPDTVMPGDDAEEKAPSLDMQPGIFPRLGPGEKFNAFAPNHPSGNYGPFLKASLHEIACALGMAYHNFAGDLEGVNYSSARVGELAERDGWRWMQRRMRDHFCRPISKGWLEMAQLTGWFTLPNYDYAAYASKLVWRGRGWDWVDPEKDIKASILAIDNSLTTWDAVLAEQGKDFDETAEELAENLKRLEELKIKLPLGLTSQATTKSTTGETANEGKTGDGGGESGGAAKGKPKTPPADDATD
jgi:lambda family phage portal protein